MQQLQNNRLIRALMRQAVDRTPVWIMRQAGRHLPEYRKLRTNVPNFMTFCKTPELACEATLQPIERYNLDAAIVFSDILTIPQAMGSELEFIKGHGPIIHNPVRCMRDIEKLKMVDVADELGYVMQAVELSVASLAGRVPLIGFAGSPWTVATYMVEGSGSKLFHTIKKMLYRQPEMLHALLDKLATLTTTYLQAQVDAGANVIMLFDSWGGILSHQTYLTFSLNYMQKIIKNLKRKVPIILFTKSGGQWLEQIAASGCNAVGLDWTVDIAQAKARVGDKVALQGNLDPCTLFAKEATIEQAVKKILTGFGPATGHVFNLGHGIAKETPIESVEIMLEAVHKYGKIQPGTNGYCHAQA